MPSKDTIPFRITKGTKQILEQIRKNVSKDFGINEEDISWKQTEIIMRIKSKNGKILQKEVKDVLAGIIK